MVCGVHSPPARRIPIEPALISHCPGLPEASGVKYGGSSSYRVEGSSLRCQKAMLAVNPIRVDGRWWCSKVHTVGGLEKEVTSTRAVTPAAGASG